MSVRNSFDFFIQWHLTERCNLSCRHCYQTKSKTKEMSLPEIMHSLHEISETLDIWKEMYDLNFSSSVNITGGEPFLHKDIFRILHEFSIRSFEVYLLTNGILIDKVKAKKMSDLGIKGVQVSIEGPETIHDSIRGKNSFTKSLRGVKNLLDAGFAVTLNVTLSSANAGYFTELVELASDIGVQQLGFSRLVPSGRGRAMAKEMLDVKTVRKLYKKIFSLKTNGLNIVTGDPVALQLTDKHKNINTDIPIGGCAAGLSGLTILPDGTLLPCRRLPVPVGNIKKDSIREVWATSPVLNNLRDKSRYQGKCRTCKKWSNCRGCRAIAYAYSMTKGKADILAHDPQCFIC